MAPPVIVVVVVVVIVVVVVVFVARPPVPDAFVRRNGPWPCGPFSVGPCPGAHGPSLWPLARDPWPLAWGLLARRVLSPRWVPKTSAVCNGMCHGMLAVASPDVAWRLLAGG